MSRIDAVRGAMDRSVEGVNSFSLIFDGVGCFPNTVRPRVVWAGVRGAPALVDLQQRLEDGLSAAGFKKEERAFSPHLTLGRVRDGVNEIPVRKIGAAVEGARLEPAQPMPVDGICLFRSVLRPDGPEYSVLYRKGISG